MDEIWNYRGLLWDGTVLTVQLAVTALALSVVLGLMGAWGKLSGGPAAQRLAGAYTTLIRGVPDLVLMLLVFFGGQRLVNTVGQAFGWWEYLPVTEFIAGSVTIGFIFGAYMTETFRGAILAIPKGQIEAAQAFGMSRWQVFSRVIWPQMVRFALPSFTNNWLVLIKSTALVSVIGLQDVVYNAFTAGRSTRQLFTFMFAVLVIYLILTAISDFGLRRLDKRYSRGVRRA